MIVQFSKTYGCQDRDRLELLREFSRCNDSLKYLDRLFKKAKTIKGKEKNLEKMKKVQEYIKFLETK